MKHQHKTIQNASPLFQHKCRPVPLSTNHLQNSPQHIKPNIAKCEIFLLNQILTKLNDHPAGVLTKHLFEQLY